MKKIHVAIKSPGKPPRSVWISPTPENIEKTVGGLPMMTQLFEDLLVTTRADVPRDEIHYCGKLLTDFYGTVIVSGTDGKHRTDLPVSWLQLKKLFPDFFRVYYDTLR